jgi:hypothetical protein
MTIGSNEGAIEGSIAGNKSVDRDASGSEADLFASGWDCILFNGPVDESMFSDLVKEVSELRENQSKCVMILTTYGGFANEAYKIGKFLQNIYKDISIFVPTVCKSAGTLIACSANSIIMGPLSELGPLDVQISKRDEIFERRSGLVTSYAMRDLRKQTYELFEYCMLNIKSRGRSISLKMASELAAKMTTDVIGKIYAGVSFESLGEDARDLQIASEYAKRLDARFRNTREGCVDRLVHGYPTHDFVIDFDEASELFARVEKPTALLQELLTRVGPEAYEPAPERALVKVVTLGSDKERGDIKDDSHDGSQS